ncbi:DUF4097 family beta strand repeat-containing protein [Culicoidibacter larvae]|uniref:DUF4097 domain-containing protein n=1 Tax=Culicoidibacter larvae TaxID=2579976 RepID=A0A5R8QEH9_9FIRM|nr:DUF4097 family beta strand repeat-containing protein [Culicoidibacter larvae]TLG75376.1 DUF4097 domain-containing protein [Culicoidibacter larvae]
MQQKRLNRILGITLAITLPVTIILFIVCTAMALSGSGINPSSIRTIDDNFANVETLEVSKLVDNVEIIAADVKDVHVQYDGYSDITTKYNEATKTLELKSDPTIGMGIINGGFKFNFFKWNHAGTLTITVPKTLTYFSSSDIVGNMTISGLSLENLKLESGVGNTTMENITVDNNASITGGVGNIDIIGLTAETLKIRGGIGNQSFENITVSGTSTIDAGIGNIYITDSKLNILTGSLGIGNLDLNGTTIEQNKLKSGIGNIDWADE